MTKVWKDGGHVEKKKLPLLDFTMAAQASYICISFC